MKLSKETIAILDSSRIEGNRLYLSGQLSRLDYVAVNKVLESIGCKWNRQAKCHISENDIDSLISDIINTGSYIDPKKELGFFPTPDNIIDIMIKEAGILQTDAVLEPSAGDGAIIKKILEKNPLHVSFCEIDKARYDKCCLLSDIYLEGLQQDFLSINQPQTFDKIVMNPPFSKQQDIEHVLHALSMLNDGGVLVSVMAEGVFFRQNSKTRAFWDTINQYPHKVVDLPENSFKSSGTAVKTRILVVGV